MVAIERERQRETVEGPRAAVTQCLVVIGLPLEAGALVSDVPEPFQGPVVTADDLADLVYSLVSETRNDSGTALLGAPRAGSNKKPLVELMTAYSNSVDEVELIIRELARSLEGLTSNVLT